jgi:hypothetical protein
MTSVNQGFSITGQGTGGLFCALGSFAVSGTVITMPERNCDRCNQA